MEAHKSQPAAALESSFSGRANNLRLRGWLRRLSRFVRARVRAFCILGEALADDPRIVRAWQRGWETSHFLRFLRMRDSGFRPLVIYDIGAHEGLWSEMCQEIFSPRESVLFEPQSHFHHQIKAKQQRLGADWALWPVALGDSDGESMLHLTRNRAASSMLEPLGREGLATRDVEAVNTELVQVRTLDGLVGVNRLPAPDLVKIDVQGFEWRVLAGGRGTLSKAQRIVVEVSLAPIYAGQPLMTEVLQLVSSWGFGLKDVSETLRSWPEGRLWQVDLWFKRLK